MTRVKIGLRFNNATWKLHTAQLPRLVFLDDDGTTTPATITIETFATVLISCECLANVVKREQPGVDGPDELQAAANVHECSMIR